MECRPTRPTKEGNMTFNDLVDKTLQAIKPKQYTVGEQFEIIYRIIDTQEKLKEDRYVVKTT